MTGRNTPRPHVRLAYALMALAAIGGAASASLAEPVQDGVQLPAAVAGPVVGIAAAQPVFTPTLSDAAPAAEQPVVATERLIGSGVASYYGNELAGNRTASGEAFDPAQLTAAHRTLPFGTLVRVTNQRNGQSVVVRINDRGPFSRGREIDLSRAAAEQIGLVRTGHAQVDIALLEG